MNAAPALAVNIGQTAARLAGQPQCFEKFREVTPFHRPHNGDGATSVSQQESSETISERAKRALERRLRPHTTLSAYELGHALRISESTIWSILSGNSKSGPSGRVLHKLVEFFGAAFLHEIFGGPNVVVIDPMDARKADALRRIAEAQEELRQLG